MAYEELKDKKEIRWKVNFSKQSKVGEKVTSKIFTSSYGQNFTQWYIDYCPNGSKDEFKGFVGLFLQQKSSVETDFLAKYSFSILNKSATKSNRILLERTGKEFESGWGIRKFISHEDLDQHIVDDMITIVCELSIYAAKQPNLQKNRFKPDGFVQNFKDLFESNVFTDFELKMNDGETLMAHKSILAARSPVFRAMLSTGMKEATTNSVEVPDFCSKTMGELLRFIYCGETEIQDDVTDLIFAAEKYEVLELKGICIDRLLSDLTDENVIETLIIVDRVSGSGRLMTDCVKIVMNNFDEVSERPKWNQLSKEMVKKILGDVIKLQQNNIIFI